LNDHCIYSSSFSIGNCSNSFSKNCRRTILTALFLGVFRDVDILHDSVGSSEFSTVISPVNVAWKMIFNSAYATRGELLALPIKDYSSPSLTSTTAIFISTIFSLILFPSKLSI